MEKLPYVPAFIITTSSSNSNNFLATAFPLIIAAINTLSAAPDLVNVLVPVVVVIITLLPSTTSFVYSKGELDKYFQEYVKSERKKMLDKLNCGL